ncbi:phospholipase [Spirosoma sp.]|uniref:alpha/beta hydrolase n=1 Tax=Spirosoma sp. TaxID=1899569 RepID=UPI002624FB68|nr:phospholipase [Spirosoma sp.]MCX6218676.1 phospholipase [Spirosoma sp.]
MLQEHHLPVRRTARYYTVGKLTEQTKRIWFCLHGFGQLAQYFGRKFSDLDDGQTLIVVPEGLSRMYLDTSYQRIGASWMSREDRDHEISDYVSYLNDLYDLILNGHESGKAGLHITFFGFSQGAATACRWLNNGHAHADRLILWAGYFPQGLADMIDSAKFSHTDMHYVYGRQDEYIRELADVNGYINRLKADAPTLQITAFDGTHRVEPAVLMALVLPE